MKALSVTFWQEVVAAGTLFSKLASLSEIPMNQNRIKTPVAILYENLLSEQFQLLKCAKVAFCLTTYVAAAETCPLLVR